MSKALAKILTHEQQKQLANLRSFRTAGPTPGGFPGGQPPGGPGGPGEPPDGHTPAVLADPVALAGRVAPAAGPLRLPFTAAFYARRRVPPNCGANLHVGSGGRVGHLCQERR